MKVDSDDALIFVMTLIVIGDYTLVLEGARLEATLPVAGKFYMMWLLVHFAALGVWFNWLVRYIVSYGLETKNFSQNVRIWLGLVWIYTLPLCGLLYAVCGVVVHMFVVDHDVVIPLRVITLMLIFLCAYLGAQFSKGIPFTRYRYRIRCRAAIRLNSAERALFFKVKLWWHYLRFIERTDRIIEKMTPKEEK